MKNLLRSIRPAVFVGPSLKDILDFPVAVRREIGQSLFEAQLGDYPRKGRPLRGLHGVVEIPSKFFDGKTSRAVFTASLGDVLYVLHASQTKPTSGPAILQRQLDLVRQRLHDAEAIHEASRGRR